MIELRALTDADVQAHLVGDDAETIRWLTGGPGTIESTKAAFEQLQRNSAARQGKRGFGVWAKNRLAGYIDADPQVTDGLDPGDVNVSYAVHPWARGHGVATAAVRLLCGWLQEEQVGARAAIRVEAENIASVGVAQKCGFAYLRDFVSVTDTDADGTPHILRLYVRPIGVSQPR